MILPCTGLTSVFFPDEGGSYDQARAICASCPMRAECLEKNIHERHGMWGGLTPKERWRLRGGQGREIRHGTEGGARTHRRRGELPCWSCAQASALAARLRYHSAA